MKSFQQIQDALGQLPNYPKIYLLGSTGAGKTSIVRAILDTAGDAFPTTLQTRTTVAPTEYVISAGIPFKSTFIFKQRDEIENSLTEIVENAIDKAILLQSNENIEDNNSVLSYLEETPDERFRLKYILSEAQLKEFDKYIIETILPKIEDKQNEEKSLNSNIIKAEISYLSNLMLDAIIDKTEEICPDYKLFSDELYIIENIAIKKEFILKNKTLLKSELNSISPLIEYARIEGDLSASWIPKEFSFILIDGEGIGHNLKEVKSSLSTRHLDFFNFSDSILLVEKSDDPFITGGKNAIETIFLNGYSKKFKLIFSKADKVDVKDYKSALNRRVGNVENALKDSNIQFNLAPNQKYYLSNLDKSADETTQKELKKLFKTIRDEFSAHQENLIDLEYDFETLLLKLNTTEFLKQWENKLESEHWTIIKAFTKRMILLEGEYRHLKPVLEYHTLIMQEINLFLQTPNHLNSEVYYAQNQIKQKFSTTLLEYIRNDFMKNNQKDWLDAFEQKGEGSSKIRKNLINKIFNTFIPQESSEDEFEQLRIKIKSYLIRAGAKEVSNTVRISIKKIELEKIYGTRNVEWSLNPHTNILIGKNGSGKSSVLKLLDAQFYNKRHILQKFKNPNIRITLNKEYENGENKDIPIEDTAHLQNIDIVLIDTFDIIPQSVSECKEHCEREQSLLDSELMKLMPSFDAYQIKLNKKFDEKSIDNQIEIRRILDNIAEGRIDEAGKIRELTERKDAIKKAVYKPIDDFRAIIDSMFKDTHKKINLEVIEKSFSISSYENELDVLDLSSGEKQILIIFLTILLKENKPYILMMDEPENSLHSEWQINFVNNIRKLNKNIQLIIATHNPLLMLDRESDEIGRISIDNEEVDTNEGGTKYLDVSATLLNYPQISSLVGTDMRNNIQELFNLKNKDELSADEQIKVDELEVKLGKTVASNFIYDRHYLQFLKFIQDNKEIDFDKLTEISDEKMNALLKEFKDLFQ
ncbi:MAG: ATP-binding protein [Sulfurimonas sp.]|jgi:ABC-type cobalamin/Fe3+-siderophores transport system ATPase subunit/GTP-binding protein EngB required for normal cell division